MWVSLIESYISIVFNNFGSECAMLFCFKKIHHEHHVSITAGCRGEI